MASEPFISFAQNGEDVVLNRALHSVKNGTYVEVGASDPQVDSISRSFYNRGWSGLVVEPNPVFAALYRQERPRDIVIEAAATDRRDPTATLHLIDGTGLSTIVDAVSSDHAVRGLTSTDITVPTVRLDDAITSHGLSESPIHFLMIDTEGAELEVIRSLDLVTVRPWILVIEATAPVSTRRTHAAWEPLVLAAGYEFCLFDGLSRFYVSSEKSEDLVPLLSYPAGVFDDFKTLEDIRLMDEISDTRKELTAVREELAALITSRSWRMTSPLRGIRRFFDSRRN